MGYHLKKIKKGKLGKISKIQEELDELEDADSQQCRILMLCEVADLVGAIQAYLNENFVNFKIKDALEMAALTKQHKEERIS